MNAISSELEWVMTTHNTTDIYAWWLKNMYIHIALFVMMWWARKETMKRWRRKYKKEEKKLLLLFFFFCIIILYQTNKIYTRASTIVQYKIFSVTILFPQQKFITDRAKINHHRRCPRRRKREEKIKGNSTTYNAFHCAGIYKNKTTEFSFHIAIVHTHTHGRWSTNVNSQILSYSTQHI